MISEDDFRAFVHDDIISEVTTARKSWINLEERYKACRQLASLSAMTDSDFLLDHMLYSAGSCDCVREDLRRIMHTLRFASQHAQAKFILAVFMCGDDQDGLMSHHLDVYEGREYDK